MLEGQHVGRRRVQLGMAYAGGFNGRPLHCLVAEGDGAVAHWVGPLIALGSAFESAGMQRGKQGEHAAVLQRLGYPDSVQEVSGKAPFIA